MAWEEHDAAVTSLLGSMEELTAMLAGVKNRVEDLPIQIVRAAGQRVESAQNAASLATDAGGHLDSALDTLRRSARELERYGTGF